MRVYLSDRVSAEKFNVGVEKRIRVRHRLAPKPDKAWLAVFSSAALYERFPRPSPADFAVTGDVCEFDCPVRDESRWADALYQMIDEVNRRTSRG